MPRGFSKKAAKIDHGKNEKEYTAMCVAEKLSSDGNIAKIVNFWVEY